MNADCVRVAAAREYEPPTRATFEREHQPSGPGALVASRVTTATPEQIAFGAFIRASAKAAELHGRPLKYALQIAWRVESGHTAGPRTISRLAALLKLPTETILSHSPALAPQADARRNSWELDILKLMHRGLARAGLTMGDVVDQLGISRATLSGWIARRSRPQGARLETLATLIDEPDLMTLLSPYLPAGKIRMRCSSCGRTRTFWPTHVKELLERAQESQPGRVTVDWDAGEGTSVCNVCTGREVGLAKVERIRKRRGRAGLIELGQELHRHRKRWAEEHPEEAAAITKGAQEANRGRDRSDLERARRRLGSLTLNPSGRFGLCRLCGQLMFAEQSDIDRAARERRPGYGNFHSRCATAWSRSTEMREWASHCRRRQDGTPPPPMPMPPRPADRISSEDELLEAYAATVLYFRQRERSSHAARDDHGVPLSVAALARTLGLSPRALYHRVDRFIELLPGEATATGRVKIWRDIFLTLNAATTGTPENVSRVAHHPEENASRVAHP